MIFSALCLILGENFYQISLAFSWIISSIISFNVSVPTSNSSAVFDTSIFTKEFLISSNFSLFVISLIISASASFIDKAMSTTNHQYKSII